MFGMSKEKKRLVREAELVVPVASILALSLDKIAMAIADEYDVDYPPMHPRILFAYTMGGAAVAVMTASVSVMKKVGVSTFGKAVDKGRGSSLRNTLLPDNATLYAKENFEYMLNSYTLFRYSPENASQGAEENIDSFVKSPCILEPLVV